MDMQSAIHTITERKNLSIDQMQQVMRLIMTGEATQAQIGGFLIGLRMKGETVDEITAAATVMRELAQKVTIKENYLVDTCGTGGDQANTFNISTASAFVAAAAGAKVAKHGNRSISSQSGSADVLEEAGVCIDLDVQQVKRCISEVGVGFMFAPLHHSAMKHAIGPRREMGVRTVFNLLGPLTNPAGAPNQVIGVFQESLVVPIAKVLAQLGSDHVLVVHSEDGLDEISIGAPTRVAELKDGDVKLYVIEPSQFGIKRCSLDSLRVENVQQSLEKINIVFNNIPGPERDIVALNAGAAIFASKLTSNLDAGVKKAFESIASGAAKKKFETLIQFSKTLKEQEQ